MRRWPTARGGARRRTDTLAVRPFPRMLAAVASATLNGAVGRPVSVEVHVSNGLPGFTIVGLPDAAVREARDRVRAAVLSSGLPWPLRRITVNLAPSGVRKGGAGLDLPIAIGLLVAAGELSPGVHRRLRLLRGAGAQRLAPPRPGHDRPGRRHCRTARPGRAAVRRARGGTGARCGRCDGAATLADLVRVLRGEAGWPAYPATDRRQQRPGPTRPDPTCGARPSAGGPSRSPRRVATTSS